MMEAIHRLRLLAECLPDGATVNLPADFIRQLALEAGTVPTDDMSVEDVAERLGRSPSRVRDWIAAGELRTYRLGREHRITEAALQEFLERQRSSTTTADQSAVSGQRRADIGAWRKVRANQPRATEAKQ